MDTVFVLAATIGGTVLVCQFLLTVLGVGIDSIEVDGPDLDAPPDTGHDGAGHGGHWLVGVLSLRTITAFLAFFGLAGLAGQSAKLPAMPTLALATAMGSIALFGVAWLMRQLTRLDSDGTVRLTDAVGRQGTVYLRIPHGGQGKVQVTLHGQMLELNARSSADRELLNGETVVVTSVLGSEFLEVAPLASLAAGDKFVGV